MIDQDSTQSEPAAQPTDSLPLWEHIYGEGSGFLGLFSATRDPQNRPVDWQEAYFAWPREAANAAAWVSAETARCREVFHCAHLLTCHRRKKEHAAALTALYVDLDTPGVELPASLPSPTAVVESSPGKRHLYWQLSRAVPPELGEQLNKRLAYAIAADTSGWDLTQLLRPLGVPNHKYADTPVVRLLHLEAKEYDPNYLEQVLPQLPASGKAAADGSTHAEVSVLPLELPSIDVQALHVSDLVRTLIRNGTDTGRRSEALGIIECGLIRAGYDDTTIAAVLLDPHNGISAKPLEQGRDWVAMDIARARDFVRTSEMWKPTSAVQAAETLLQETRSDAPSSPFRTLAQIRADHSGTIEIQWLLDGYIARGAITLLVGAAKGGKSTWLAGLLKALETGTAYCGLSTQAADVVYLIEEDSPSLDARARAIGLDPHRVVWLTAGASFNQPTWEARIDAATDEAERIGAGLLVIDTFSFWAELDPQQEWDNAVVTARFKHLRKATAKGLAVVVVHHFNKQGQYRGATAFKAAVDIHCEFKPRLGRPTQRTLTAAGRFGGRALALDFDQETQRYFEAAGTPIRKVSELAERSQSPTRALTRTAPITPSSATADWLRSILPTGDGQTVRELIAAFQDRWGKALSDSQAERLLKQWVADGTVQRTGTPRSRANPLRYSRVD